MATATRDGGGLFAQAAVDNDGDGAVVMQSHVHVGAENAAADSDSTIFLQ